MDEILKSSSQEPQGQYQANLAQSILRRMRFKDLQIRTIQFSKRKWLVSSFTNQRCDIKHSLAQIYLLIWSGFSSELCGPWASCSLNCSNCSIIFFYFNSSLCYYGLMKKHCFLIYLVDNNRLFLKSKILYLE